MIALRITIAMQAIIAAMSLALLVSQRQAPASVVVNVTGQSVTVTDHAHRDAQRVTGSDPGSRSYLTTSTTINPASDRPSAPVSVPDAVRVTGTGVVLDFLPFERTGGVRRLQDMSENKVSRVNEFQQ